VEQKTNKMSAKAVMRFVKSAGTGLTKKGKPAGLTCTHEGTRVRGQQKNMEEGKRGACYQAVINFRKKGRALGIKGLSEGKEKHPDKGNFQKLQEEGLNTVPPYAVVGWGEKSGKGKGKIRREKKVLRREKEKRRKEARRAALVGGPPRCSGGKKCEKKKGGGKQHSPRVFKTSGGPMEQKTKRNKMRFVNPRCPPNAIITTRRRGIMARNRRKVAPKPLEQGLLEAALGRRVVCTFERSKKLLKKTNKKGKYQRS